MFQNVSVGLVADWLVTYAGSEKVVAEFIKLFPQSELYSVIDFLSDESRTRFMNKKLQLLLFKNYLRLKKTTNDIYHSCLLL